MPNASWGLAMPTVLVCHGIIIEAAKWIRKAAEQGLAQAELNLGKAYILGSGVPKDYAEGFRWIYKAADQGFADAQILVGYAIVWVVAFQKTT